MSPWRQRCVAGWLAALACLGVTLPAWGSSVSVADAWIRAVPPGLTVTAAYFTLRNRGGNARTVTAVSSPAFRAAEIHQTLDDDGVSRMVYHASVDIEAGQTLSFEPHGYHVMLFDPLQPLRPGDRIPLTIMLWDGTRLDAEADVRR